MPVADHFMSSRDDTDGQTGDVYLGEVCETCCAHFAGGKTELWRHARDEHGTVPDLRCPVPGCGRRFFAAAMCADHRAHHRTDDDRPLTCQLCGRLFGNPMTYDRHVKVAHPEARAAMCGVCHTYEGDVPTLVDHVRRRHGSEIWPETAAAGASDPMASRQSIRCTVCGKRYGNNRNMYAHRRVHGIAAADAADDDDVVPVHPQPLQ